MIKQTDLKKNLSVSIVAYLQVFLSILAVLAHLAQFLIYF